MIKTLKPKRFVIGDIHGRIKALKEVLISSNFDYVNDKLIVLGDVVDGGFDTYKVVEELLKIKNLIFVRGNHDEWFMNHISSGWSEDVWMDQGGQNTIESYRRSDRNIPVTHQDFFNRSKLYHVEDNMLFVHGGIIPNIPIEAQTRHDLLWDRELIEYARINPVDPFKKVFVGHTAMIKGPHKFNNLFTLDCGAGWQGYLCIMDVDSEEYWRSSLQVPAIREAPKS